MLQMRSQRSFHVLCSMFVYSLAAQRYIFYCSQKVSHSRNTSLKRSKAFNRLDELQAREGHEAMGQLVDHDGFESELLGPVQHFSVLIEKVGKFDGNVGLHDTEKVLDGSSVSLSKLFICFHDLGVQRSNLGVSTCISIRSVSDTTPWVLDIKG
jgi:hypothetical protein